MLDSVRSEGSMRMSAVESLKHNHAFLGVNHVENERRVLFVVALTTVMMAIEIVGGAIFGSMALVADGWHMSTHAGALAVSAIAYRFARRRADDPHFTFGTGKVGDLAGYSSAMALAIVALLIGWESVHRLFNPAVIDFDSAIFVAAIGLAVNLASAWLLRDRRHHGDHGHTHHVHHHNHHHHDHNLRAAHLHVLADAVISVLAIVALIAGRSYGWTWMDPAMGVVGALVIAHWSFDFLRTAGAVLLDAVPDKRLVEHLRTRLEEGQDRVSDLHLWRLGPGHLAVIASIVSDTPLSADAYKRRLAGITGLSHITIEVNARG
jgi:cation diffusion facilitator family transporter